jgi:hypothetical protein
VDIAKGTISEFAIFEFKPFYIAFIKFTISEFDMIEIEFSKSARIDNSSRKI